VFALNRPLQGLQNTAVYQEGKTQGMKNETNDCVSVGGGGGENTRKKKGKRPKVGKEDEKFFL